MSPLTPAAQLLRVNPLCDDCLGRQFAQLGHGLSNAERGRALRVTLHLRGEASLEVPALCPLCLNHFERVEEWAQRALEAVRGLEFERYLVGTKAPAFLHEAEEDLCRELGITSGEPLKQAYNRTVGRRFGELVQVTRGRPVAVDFKNPELLIAIDLIWERLSVQVNPLYVFGRYRKLLRGIPQTHWPCTHCKGRGCPACGGTGAQYPQSVESLIGEPLQALCGGDAYLLHGAGREDIDARMLGTGRPFVLEVKRPRKRFFDWQAVAAHLNARAAGKVEVEGLTPVTGRAVGRIKQRRARKRYRARVELAAPVEPQALQRALEALVGPVEQRTPQRVAHRRADRVRRREVFAVAGKVLGPQAAEVELECSGGLYVKELISGDEGRTRPSLAQALGVGARVVELDVLGVLGQFL